MSRWACAWHGMACAKPRCQSQTLSCPMLSCTMDAVIAPEGLCLCKTVDWVNSTRILHCDKQRGRFWWDIIFSAHQVWIQAVPLNDSTLHSNKQRALPSHDGMISMLRFLNIVATTLPNGSFVVPSKLHSLLRRG